jgi:hypothetical protein
MSAGKAEYLATIVRGLEQLEREKEEYMTEWKDRKKKLENALATGVNDVLSGQAGLPLEPPSQEAKAAAAQYPS